MKSATQNEERRYSSAIKSNKKIISSKKSRKTKNRKKFMLNQTDLGLAQGSEIMQGLEDDGQRLLFCFCNDVEYGEMIQCESENCKAKWFHLKCVNLETAPEGKWFCTIC